MTIEVTYRWTSRLSMRIVKNGDVHVSAPIGLSRKKVEAFIEQHSDWIVKARKKTEERLQKRNAFYRQLPLETKAQKEEALKRLKALVEPMVERYSKEMGVKPSRLYYKSTISRWGQCHIKDRSIYISTYVLLLPDWCVEHVVVHELCHLLEPSHNARFHALMDQYYPRWREARKIMKNMEQKRTTPERITELQPNEIFVFGSNLQGMHGGGAALIAYRKFGAIMGQGVGLQGQSYGIPTMQGGVETIRPYVVEFIEFAKTRSDLTFLVTRIGCGIAGFTDEEIAPLFEKAHGVENIVLPPNW